MYPCETLTITYGRDIITGRPFINEWRYYPLAEECVKTRGGGVEPFESLSFDREQWEALKSILIKDNITVSHRSVRLSRDRKIIFHKTVGGPAPAPNAYKAHDPAWPEGCADSHDL